MSIEKTMWPQRSGNILIFPINLSYYNTYIEIYGFNLHDTLISKLNKSIRPFIRCSQNQCEFEAGQNILHLGLIFRSIEYPTG